MYFQIENEAWLEPYIDKPDIPDIHALLWGME